MSKIPVKLLYKKSHEWVKVDGDTIIVGITDYAQSKLGDVVFVELPNIGDDYDAEGAVATVESVKGVSEIYAPVSGSILEINEELVDVPELINEDPYGEGWIFSMKVDSEADLDTLLSAEEYEAIIEEEA